MRLHSLMARVPDPDGNIVKYEWKDRVSVEPGCPYAKLVNKNSPTVQLTAPENIQSDCSNYYYLVVTDNDGKLGVDSILVTVLAESNNSKEIMMSNIYQMPETIRVGEKFSIAVIISNNLEKPVHFYSSDCGGRILDV